MVSKKAFEYASGGDDIEIELYEALNEPITIDNVALELLCQISLRDEKITVEQSHVKPLTEALSLFVDEQLRLPPAQRASEFEIGQFVRRKTDEIQNI